MFFLCLYTDVSFLVEATGLFPVKRRLREEGTRSARERLSLSHSCFRQRVKRLQHRPLLLVTDRYPVTEVFLPVRRWWLLGSGATDLQGGGVCPSEVPRP